MRSPCFYSWKGGYELCILLHPHGFGDGNGPYLSIYVVIGADGEFDQILSKSTFKGKIEIALLSQQEDKENLVNNLYEQPLVNMHEGSGWHEFIPLEQLENSPYLKNDTIFIQVTCTKD